ncbi:hypothetical protein C1J01_09735 [Nonomuraea aridisoli]|uniref:Transposase putative helix-turn-helix domain-containing protein n=1 Tax=Nonomuraea aridisoli TaxID=2070368 RepID=A0A2W2E7Q7_9ACTN|nr:hypothetical protein C1J01_09735 [Nonomuraea aridisoli]
MRSSRPLECGDPGLQPWGVNAALRRRILSVPIPRLIGVSRYRLTPTPAQGQALLEHCGHARFV